MEPTNTLFLEALFQCCKQLGLVETQYDFSKLCGRRSTWFSASKCRNLPISTHAAVTLSVRLRQRAETELPPKQRVHARRLSETLLELAATRAAQL